ncbi:hypothetical protein AAKU64_004493, partial [Undibacterium sp. GrIS 1.8]
HLARNGRSFLIYFALLAIKLLSGVSFCKNLICNPLFFTTIGLEHAEGNYEKNDGYMLF